MKVTAALVFTVPDHCDATSLSSLLDAVCEALRAGPPVFIRDVELPAFRLGERGSWAVKAGATFDPSGDVVQGATDVQLLDALDATLAAYLAEHPTKLPSTTSALDLVQWLGTIARRKH